MPKTSRSPARLSHVDARGRVKMVDVGGKPITAREAIARGSIAMSAHARRQIRSGAVKKGDPLQTARLAGILAAKQTSSLIPLCHPLPLSSINVELTPNARGYDIEARVRTTAQTGVEMEALTAVAVAALTIYDMVKAVDKAMVIGEIRLAYKAGGRSGVYTRQEGGKAGRQEGKAGRQEGRKARQEGKAGRGKGAR
jgi:cyclic pyranopterin phosphate synthase